MLTRWVDIKTKAIARIVSARIARPKKLELGPCWHDLHQACLSGSSFTVPRWSDKLLAFVSVALCEVERIQESGGVPRCFLTFDFCQQLHARSFGCKCVSGGHWPMIPASSWSCWKVSTADNKVTWLILPVVLCLSQRLSHACLSKQLYTVKLRTAHYISNNLCDGFLLHG